MEKTKQKTEEKKELKTGKTGFKTILKAIFFSEDSINLLKEKVDFKIGILALILSTFILAIPTDLATFTFTNWALNFLIIFIGLFITLTIIFGFSKLLRAEIDYESFLSLASFMLAASLLIVSLPVLLIFEFLINVKVLSAVLFSLVPYYNFIIFGYACEVISGIKKIGSAKRIFIALIAMTLIFLFYTLLAFITF